MAILITERLYAKALWRYAKMHPPRNHIDPEIKHTKPHSCGRTGESRAVRKRRQHAPRVHAAAHPISVPDSA
eukprot:3369398-Rhodomonas_salina.1